MRCYPLDKEQFIHQVTNNKGFSQGLTYEYGYMVALQGFETVVKQQTEDLDMLYKMYRAYFGSVVKRLKKNPSLYLGCWCDGNDVYFDLSEYYTQQDVALKVARERQQLAIWSIHAKESIYMKGA